MNFQAFTRRLGQALARAAPAHIAVYPRSHQCPLSRTVTTAITSQDKIQLRAYQEECIQAVLTGIRDGHKRMGVSLATGSGKTVIFTHLVSRLPPRSDNGTKTLILAHRRELVEQAAKHCTRTYPDLKVEVEMGPIHASGTADITVASIQSIISKDRLAKFDPDTFKLVLVDEAHHIVAPGYLRTLEHFGLEKKRDGTPTLVGVSATFGRFDGLALGSAIDQIVYHKDYLDMIDEKWLSDVRFTAVQSKIDLSGVRSGANGDFHTGELSRIVNTAQANEIVVRIWREKAHSSGRNSTLAFCVDVEHVTGLAIRFREHGFDARFITGETPKLQRSETLEAFRRGDFPILVNCGVFTEGTDIPNIDCVVLARPTRSRNLLIQMIGRGMRLHRGKTDCHIIDMVSTLDTGVVSIPTLLGLDPGALLNEATVEDIDEMKAQSDSEAEAAAEARELLSTSGLLDDAALSNVSVTLTEYSTIFDLISDTSGEKHINGISRYAWVCVGREKYVLCSPSGSYIRLERLGDDDLAGGVPPYRAVEVKPIPNRSRTKSPFAPPREIVRASTFADAVHGCDKFASESYPRTFIDRGQAWRRKPATSGQLEFLNKLGDKSAQESGQEPFTSADLTKGQAMDMITKVKHGAKGRFAQSKLQKRRQERVQLRTDRDRERKQNEVVRVGAVA